MWIRCAFALALSPGCAQAVNSASASAHFASSSQFIAERDPDAPISSGDAIYLEAVGGSGHINVDSDAQTVWLNKEQFSGNPPVFIKKAAAGPVLTGEAIRLVSHRGYVVDVEDSDVQARWKDFHPFQKLVLTKVGGGNVVNAGDHVQIKSGISGKCIQVTKATVLAEASCGAGSQFKIHRLPYGGLHDVVGPDGVLMITLQREGEDPRSGFSLEKLSQAQIFPVGFAATDAKSAPYWELHMTCPLESETGTAQWCNDMGRLGQPGCRSTVEQAITDSHRRALVAALTRESKYNWTAIIEDDVVPFMPEKFSEAFRQAWRDIPDEVKMVRLGWCTFESDLGEVKDRAHGVQSGHGDFKLVRERWWTDSTGNEHYYTGGCTTGYMVHKSFIPEMLKIFPCCCPIDCCLERQLFYAPAQDSDGNGGEWSKWRGHEIMVDMDGWLSRSYSKGFATFNQSGVLLQDNRNIQSERPAWNQVA